MRAVDLCRRRVWAHVTPWIRAHTALAQGYKIKQDMIKEGKKVIDDAKARLAEIEAQKPAQEQRLKELEGMCVCVTCARGRLPYRQLFLVPQFHFGRAFEGQNRQIQFGRGSKRKLRICLGSILRLSSYILL